MHFLYFISYNITQLYDVRLNGSSIGIDEHKLTFLEMSEFFGEYGVFGILSDIRGIVCKGVYY
jgi:hypothetical protein